MLGSLGPLGWRAGESREGLAAGARAKSSRSELTTSGPNIFFLLTCGELSVCCCLVIQIWVKTGGLCPTDQAVVTTLSL